jgi:hypothetical protein
MSLSSLLRKSHIADNETNENPRKKTFSRDTTKEG